MISYLRIIPEKEKVLLGRVLIDNRYRGKGKGRALLERAKEVCKEWFVDTVIEVHAQAHLVKLYCNHLDLRLFQNRMTLLAFHILRWNCIRRKS